MEDTMRQPGLLAGWVGAAFLLIFLAAAPAHAQSATDHVNVEKTADGVEYASGGVGENALQQINEKAKDFNLKLVFTLNEGNYIADVNVAVKDAKGRTVVEDVAEGPIFLAKLPAGQYNVTANYEGKTQTRKLKVGKGLRTEYLRWPSNPETDNPLPRETADRPASTRAAASEPG
jgi:hypothetical protein